MKVHTDKRLAPCKDKQRCRVRARAPTVGLAVPNLNSSEVLGPGRIKTLPRFSSRRVRQNGHSTGFPNSLEHSLRWEILAEEWDVSPRQDVNDVFRVAVFNSGNDQ